MNNLTGYCHIISFRRALYLLIVLFVVASARQNFFDVALPPGTKVNIAGSLFANKGGLDVREGEILYTEMVAFLRVPVPGTSALDISYKQEAFFRASPENRIVSVCQKTDNKSLIFLLTQNGEIWVFTYLGAGGIYARQPYPLSGVSGPTNFKKMAGDALYTLDTGGKMFVSRDTAVTWSIDTLGFNTAYAQDFAIDSAQYVYAATDKGLFRQHPDSSIWRFVDSLYYDNFGTLTYPNLRSVFVDRKNRILASPWFTPLGVFSSTNGGLIWTHSNQGIESFSVGNFGDDAFGNLYAIGGPGGRTNQLFRSSDSGATWVRIDTAMTNRVKPAPDQFFNSISGDTLLIAATTMGLFVSTNQGATWQESNQGITDENPLGIVKLPSGRLVYSGTLGIFIKNPGDTVWTKKFPVNGYQQFGALSRGGGSLFARAEKYIDQTTSLVIRSTDDGLTWQYDTTGIGNAKGPYWYVDETGTQHLGDRWFSFNPTTPLAFSKPLGGSWSPDTLGLRPSGTVDEIKTFFSDRSGYLYAATETGKKLWRRPIGGGTWVLDTTGLSVITDPLLMGAGRNGIAYVATSLTLANPSTLHRRSGGTWSKVPLPADRPADNIDAISVDSSGALWVAFSSFNFYFGTGVYSTTNNGATWTKHGLDSIPVNFNSQYSGTYGLISYGDTTYVLTVGRGAYALTRSSGTTAVEENITSPRSFALEQNYPNPFNPMTTIEFDLPSASHVRLRIFDLLGREVASLVNEERNAGRHKAEWNASKFSSGVYFYRIEAGPFVAVRKLVLVK